LADISTRGLVVVGAMKVNGTSMVGNDALDKGDSSMQRVDDDRVWIATLGRKPISQENGFAICAKPATLGR
jgi:hypothetical protein